MTVTEQVDAIRALGADPLRKLVVQALEGLPAAAELELLPAEWLRPLGLPPLREAILALHAPPRDAVLLWARQASDGSGWGASPK